MFISAFFISRHSFSNPLLQPLRIFPFLYRKHISFHNSWCKTNNALLHKLVEQFSIRNLLLILCVGFGIELLLLFSFNSALFGLTFWFPLVRFVSSCNDLLSSDPSRKHPHITEPKTILFTFQPFLMECISIVAFHHLFSITPIIVAVILSLIFSTIPINNFLMFWNHICCR